MSTLSSGEPGGLEVGQWASPPMPIRSGKVTTDAAARLPRQSLRRTRAYLIEAAVRIVNEYVAKGPRDDDPAVDLLPFVLLDEVLEGASELARRDLVEDGGLLEDERVAPLTPGAFYKAFAADHEKDAGRGGTLTAFRRLVTKEMVDDSLLTDSETYIELGQAAVEAGVPWQEVARLAVEAEFKRWSETPALVLMNALALHAEDGHVSDWTRKVYEDELSELVKIYETLLPVFHRQLRNGITLQHLAVTVSDLIAGMSLSSRFVPASRNLQVTAQLQGPDSRAWNLCALAAVAIMDAFTESVIEDHLRNPGATS